MEEVGHRDVVSVCRRARHGYGATDRGWWGAAVGRLVALLCAAYDDGQLPAARAFVEALGQALQPDGPFTPAGSAQPLGV